MFVLSEDGKVFLYKIKEHFPSREEISMLGTKSMPNIKGELLINDDPILVKDLGKV